MYIHSFSSTLLSAWYTSGIVLGFVAIGRLLIFEGDKMELEETEWIGFKSHKTLNDERKPPCFPYQKELFFLEPLS